MTWAIRSGGLRGSLVVPGDKSIAHRALMLGAIADTPSTVRNLPHGQDVMSTVTCLTQLGVAISRDKEVTYIAGADFLKSDKPLDAGNSGTTIRLLMGLLAGQDQVSHLVGDSSLSRRPMDRVMTPLELMGARFDSRGGALPITVYGGRLHACEYTLPIASAQVKSAILFAALFADGSTTVREPVPTRDHTERMLSNAGVEIVRDGQCITVNGGQRPHGLDIEVPGDFSSACFFLTAAGLSQGAIEVRNVGVNPARNHFLNVLKTMGATVNVRNERIEGGEPVADVQVTGRVHQPVCVDNSEIPLLVDELPLVALLATQAHGTSLIRGAAELRVKESDRIAGVTNILRLLGADLDEEADGWTIRGPSSLRAASLPSYGDHRLAMLGAIAGTVAVGETIVEDGGHAAVSFPEFLDRFRSLGGVAHAS